VHIAERLPGGGRLVTAVEVARDAQRAFKVDRGKRLSAGLAYYSIFALVPTIFLAVAIAGAVVGQEATEGRLVARLDDVLGAAAAKQIEDAVVALRESTNSSGFALISAGVVVYSASALFVAWRDTLELIWDVPYESGLATSLRSRAFGALVPVGAGILLATIVLLELLVAFAEQLVSSDLLDAILRMTGTIIPTLSAVVALSLFYRYTTRTRRPEWREVWPGTIVASIAIAVASWGYGLYVRFVGSNSVAGAATAVVVGLVFVYYVAQILLFGAEVIRVLQERRKGPIDPASVVSG
jgi:membrane protein